MFNSVLKFDQIVQMRKLTLCSCKIGDDGLIAISSCVSIIEELDISDRSISILGSRSLAEAIQKRNDPVKMFKFLRDVNLIIFKHLANEIFWLCYMISCLHQKLFAVIFWKIAVFVNRRSAVMSGSHLARKDARKVRYGKVHWAITSRWVGKIKWTDGKSTAIAAPPVIWGKKVNEICEFVQSCLTYYIDYLLPLLLTYIVKER